MTAPPSPGSKHLTGADLRRGLVTGAVMLLWLLSAWFAIQSVVTDHNQTRIGVDAHAYWNAARVAVPYHVLPMHEDAFEYSPVFLDLMRPFGHLPFALFYGLWLVVEAAVFVILTRGVRLRWRMPILLLCVNELAAGNLAGWFSLVLVATATAPEAWALPLLTKITPGGTGLLWYLTRSEWRHLLRAAASTALLAGFSVALQPRLWRSWLRYLHTSSSGHTVDIAVRTGLAVVVTIVAGRRSWLWLLPAAFILCTPVSGNVGQYFALVPVTLHLWRRYAASRIEAQEAG